MNYPIEGEAPAHMPKPTRTKLILLTLAAIGTVGIGTVAFNKSSSKEVSTTTAEDSTFELYPVEDSEDVEDVVENMIDNDVDDSLALGDEFDDDVPLRKPLSAKVVKAAASLFAHFTLSLDRIIKDLDISTNEFKQTLNLSNAEYKAVAEHVANNEMDKAVDVIAHKMSAPEAKELKKMLKSYATELAKREEQAFDLPVFLKSSNVNVEDFQRDFKLSKTEYKEVVDMCKQGFSAEALDLLKSKVDSNTYKNFNKALIAYKKTAAFVRFSSNLMGASVSAFTDKALIFKANFDMDIFLKEIGTAPKDFIEHFGLDANQYKAFKQEVSVGQFDAALKLIEEHLSKEEKKAFKAMMREYAKKGAPALHDAFSNSLKSFLHLNKSNEAKFSKDWELTKEEFDSLNDLTILGKYAKVKKQLIEKMGAEEAENFVNQLQSARTMLVSSLFQAHLVFMGAAAVTKNESITLDDVVAQLEISKKEFMKELGWTAKDYKRVDDLIKNGDYQAAAKEILKDVDPSAVKQLTYAMKQAQKTTSALFDQFANVPEATVVDTVVPEVVERF
eukprot:GDKJ01031483.1.p1 GENE.GDKJ01031483.1~~GDKJ01031483.1.p1  ORF type:complete len:571 (+),score=207.01 GDKJ01031483.1:38-1714(+)